jgi:hypothetical protein
MEHASEAKTFQGQGLLAREHQVRAWSGQPEEPIMRGPALPAGTITMRSYTIYGRLAAKVTSTFGSGVRTGVSFPQERWKAPGEALVGGQKTLHLGRFSHDEQGHHVPRLERREQVIELSWGGEQQMDVSDHH